MSTSGVVLQAKQVFGYPALLECGCCGAVGLRRYDEPEPNAKVVMNSTHGRYPAGSEFARDVLYLTVDRLQEVIKTKGFVTEDEVHWTHANAERAVQGWYERGYR